MIGTKIDCLLCAGALGNGDEREATVIHARLDGYGFDMVLDCGHGFHIDWKAPNNLINMDEVDKEWRTREWATRHGIPAFNVKSKPVQNMSIDSRKLQAQVLPILERFRGGNKYTRTTVAGLLIQAVLDETHCKMRHIPGTPDHLFEVVDL